MEALVTRIGIALAANAAALLAAAVLLDRVHVRFLFFFFLVALFTVVSLLVTPAVATLVKEHAAPLASFAGLIATWVTLLVTDIMSRSLKIEGLMTWVMATLIVWGASLAVQYVAPLIIQERKKGSASGLG